MDLQTLQQECLACRRCSLCDSRTHVVFGQGVPNAEVLFVGEGPGANEDAQGLPFVGRSGQLLDHYLEAVDLSRDKNVYIAIRCRKNPRLVFLGFGNSSSYCVPRSLCALAALPPNN